MVGGLAGGAGSRKLAGLVIVVTFLLGCVVAQAANASVLGWRVNGGAIEAATSVKASGSLKFTDKKGGIFAEAVEVECKVAGEGSVGLGKSGEVTKWTATGCVTLQGICGEPSITVKKLPWHTELVEVEGKIRDTIATGGSGAPEYEVACGKLVEDKCSGNMSTAVENVSGGVDTVFDPKAGALSCTRGGTGSGSIEGTELIENPTGGTLTAANGAPLETVGWYVKDHLLEGKGDIVDTKMASGRFVFSDNHSGLFGEEVQIKCTVAGRGTVGPLTAGEITEWTATSCENTEGLCGEPSIVAKHLPWQTKLARVDGEVSDVITGGEYEVSCYGTHEYSCALAPSSKMRNTENEEGVWAEFPSSGAQECGRGTSRMEGSYLIHEPEGSSLRVA